MSDVIRNATIRLAIEWAQSQLVLPNIDGMVVAQKAAATASQATSAAMNVQSSAAAKLGANVTQLSAEEMALTDAITAQAQATMQAADAAAKLSVAETTTSAAAAEATGTTNAFAGAQTGLYRGISSSIRGIVLMGVSTGELNAKSIQAIVAVEGLAGAMRGATRLAVAFDVAVAPVLIGMVALVATLYELEQAWTEESREEEAAIKQMEKNFEQEKKDAELSMQVWRAWGDSQREGRQDAIRSIDQYMEALRKAHTEEQALTNAAVHEFLMKPGERMRLNRDRATMEATGSLNDPELRFVLGHTTGTERDSFGRRAEDKIKALGGPARYSDGQDEKDKASMDKAEHLKTTTESTARSIETLVTSVINGIKIRLEEAERAIDQHKQAKISHDAASGIGMPSFSGIGSFFGSASPLQ